MTNIICKVFGHKWRQWQKDFIDSIWTRYCDRCWKEQRAGKGKRVNYKGIK